MHGSTKLIKAYTHYFKAFDHLQIVIFSCYLHRDYIEKKYFYENALHKSRLKLFAAMKKIRLAISRDAQKKLTKLENLYETLFSLNTLKLRILDQATFEVCEAEFKKISHSLSAALQHIIAFLHDSSRKDIKIAIDNVTDIRARKMLDGSAKIIGSLSNKIDELEELYRNTLQVVAENPIFFLFFVQDLIALRDELESFFLELLNG